MLRARVFPLIVVILQHCHRGTLAGSRLSLQDGMLVLSGDGCNTSQQRAMVALSRMAERPSLNDPVINQRPAPRHLRYSLQSNRSIEANNTFVDLAYGVPTLLTRVQVIMNENNTIAVNDEPQIDVEQSSLMFARANRWHLRNSSLTLLGSGLYWTHGLAWWVQDSTVRFKDSVVELQDVRVRSHNSHLHLNSVTWAHHGTGPRGPLTTFLDANSTALVPSSGLFSASVVNVTGSAWTISDVRQTYLVRSLLSLVNSTLTIINSSLYLDASRVYLSGSTIQLINSTLYTSCGTKWTGDANVTDTAIPGLSRGRMGSRFTVVGATSADASLEETAD